MSIKSVADAIVDTALSLSENYSDAIKSTKLAALLLQDEFELLKENSRIIAELICDGKVEEAKAYALLHGMRFTYNSEDGTISEAIDDPSE